MEFDLRAWLDSEVGIPSRGVEARKGLYDKLVTLRAKYGVPVLAIIAECWEYAETHRKQRARDEYWAYLVKKRLSEAGMWDDPRRYRNMPEEQLVREGFKRTKENAQVQGAPGPTTTEESRDSSMAADPSAKGRKVT